jgi:hypothetical protein
MISRRGGRLWPLPEYAIKIRDVAYTYNARDSESKIDLKRHTVPQKCKIVILYFPKYYLIYAIQKQ